MVGRWWVGGRYVASNTQWNLSYSTFNFIFLKLKHLHCVQVTFLSVLTVRPGLSSLLLPTLKKHNKNIKFNSIKREVIDIIAKL